MALNTPIRQQQGQVAPTPQNTPLTSAPISQGVVRPGVSDIAEEAEPEVDVAAILQSDAGRSVLEDIVQSRLASLIGQSSGYVESLPVEAKRSLAALQGVQAQHEKLQKDFKREIWELEKKYFNRTKPLYERRASIVSGAATPRMEEIAAGEALALKEDASYTPLPTPPNEPENAPIADFWLTALRNHAGVRSFLSIRDLDALKHLMDVQLSYLSGRVFPATGPDAKAEGATGPVGYKLSFFFSPNEYFENEVLEKTYIYKPEINWVGDYVYEQSEGTQIRWKDGKDLTVDLQEKNQRSKHTSRSRTVKRAADIDSFFKIFSPPIPPTDEAIEKDEIGDDDLSELEAAINFDFELGDDFKDRIIPHAVDYFTGKALEWEDEDDDEWEEDETDYEDDGDE